MIKVVIEVSSKADLPLSEQIAEALDRLGVQSVLKITLAHQAPPQRYETIKEHAENDIYSSLINTQKTAKQYLSMADETLGKNDRKQVAYD